MDQCRRIFENGILPKKRIPRAGILIRLLPFITTIVNFAVGTLRDSPTLMASLTPDKTPPTEQQLYIYGVDGDLVRRSVVKSFSLIF